MVGGGGGGGGGGETSGSDRAGRVTARGDDDDSGYDDGDPHGLPTSFLATFPNLSFTGRLSPDYA